MYGRVGHCGSTASPSRPRSQKLWVFVRRSATIVGVVSVRLSNSSTTPVFNPTNTRVSGNGANFTTVGAARPWNTGTSLKPLGSGPDDPPPPGLGLDGP